MEIRQFPSPKQASSLTNSGPSLPTASPTASRLSSGRKIDPICGTMGRIERQQMDPLYLSKQVQDPIQVTSSPIGCSNNLIQFSLQLLREEIAKLLKKRAVERVRNQGTPSFYLRVLLVPAFTSAKWRREVTFSNSSFLLNLYMNKAF